MESSENELSSFFEQTSTATVATSPTKLFSQTSDGSLSQSHVAPYPHSQAQLENARKKRGRPRKYDSPEEALAAKKAASTSSFSSFKKSLSSIPGSAGQGFTPHVLNVAPGEDISQKIMTFMQQSKLAMCILSASGSVSNASLRQPATSGGNITYEGLFEIVSLSGSYIVNELGGRAGGLSLCLSNTDGQFIGGSIVGPLKAAGPVQVIVGTFSIDPKEISAGIKNSDVSTSKLPAPVGEPVSSLGFSSAIDSSSGNPIRGSEEHQAIGGSHFMLQRVHMAPPYPLDWGSRPDSRNSGLNFD